MLFLPLSVKPLNIFEKHTPRIFSLKLHRKSIENPTKPINKSTKIAHTRVLGEPSSDVRLLGTFWARFGASLGRLGRVLEASWRVLGACWPSETCSLSSWPHRVPLPGAKRCAKSRCPSSWTHRVPLVANRQTSIKKIGNRSQLEAVSKAKSEET